MATVCGSGCVVCCGSSWHFQLEPTYVRTSKWLANSYGSVRSSIDSYHMSSTPLLRIYPTGVGSEGAQKLGCCCCQSGGAFAKQVEVDLPP